MHNTILVFILLSAFFFGFSENCCAQDDTPSSLESYTLLEDARLYVSQYIKDGVITMIDAGSEIKILEIQGYMAKIVVTKAFGKHIGFIEKKHINSNFLKEFEEEIPIGCTSGIPAQVSLDGAQCYAKPFVLDGSIRTLPANEWVCVISKKQDFLEVEYQGNLYFILHINGNHYLAQTFGKAYAPNEPQSKTQSTSRKSSCNATQCSGQTKEGRRCHNMTTNCSGLCHVHS